MSKVVTIACGECEDSPVNGAVQITFAIDYDAEDIEDAQQHMDRMFVARCGACGTCSWEVIAVNKPESVPVLDMGR